MICTYVVGRYKKAGNFMGKYKENVEKGSFSRNVCEKLDQMISDIGSGKCKTHYLLFFGTIFQTE